MFALLQLLLLSVVVGGLSGLTLAAQPGAGAPERHHLGRR
jgi:hypothetical protein